MEKKICDLVIEEVKGYVNQYLIDYDRFIIKIAGSVKYKCPRLEFEDIKQQLILSLLTHLDTFDISQVETSSTYFSQIIINSANNIVKRYWQLKNKANVECLSLDGSLKERIDDGQLIGIVSDSCNDSLYPDNYYSQKELLDILKKVYKKLSPIEKKIFKLYMNGYNISKIAEIVKRSKKSVYNSIANIKDLVKSYL